MDAKKLEKLIRRLQRVSPSELSGELAEEGSPEAGWLLSELANHEGPQEEWVDGLEALLKAIEQPRIEKEDEQEALCRRVIMQDDPAALKAVLANAYAPRDKYERALFFFLTEQWEKYESLDFDHGLLKTVYKSGDGKLRKRISEKALKSGRMEWVNIVVGDRDARRLSLMSDQEWKVTLSVLATGGRWKELWQLAQEAPPIWSSQILRQLGASKWIPQQSERDGFNYLLAFAKFSNAPALVDAVKPDNSSPLLRCRATLDGHKDGIDSVIISADGGLMVSGSRDGTARLWSLPAGRSLNVLPRHESAPSCLAISPDGQILVCGGSDGYVHAWSLPSGSFLKSLEAHNSSINCLAITPDGQVLVTGGTDLTGATDRVVLWSLPDCQARKILESPAHCLAITGDGRLLATGDLGGTVRMFSLPNGQELKRWTAHRGFVRSLAIGPNGRALASAGNGYDDNDVRLWSIPDGELLEELHGHTDDIECLAFSPDGRLLASGSWDGTVRLWGRGPLKALVGHGPFHSAVHCLAFSPNGRILASGSADMTIRLWSMPDGQLLKALEGHEDSVLSLSFSPDGRTLVSAGFDTTVRLWSLEAALLWHLPVKQMNPSDLRWLRDGILDTRISENERAMLEFIAALTQWRQRFDIEVGEAIRRIGVGEFDIEIEG